MQCPIRGPDDDYQQGDSAAVAGSRILLREFIEQALDYMDRPPEERVIEQEVYLDFYGKFRTPVFAPFFHVGRAAHILQDCFSHTVRSEEDGLKKIVHVANYVDAISEGYGEKRDGLAHSDYMDRCEKAALAPRVKVTEEATAELFGAVTVAMEQGNPSSTEAVLESWISLKPGCDFDNDMCGNHRMLTLARRDPTEPYFDMIFGCSFIPPGKSTAIFPLSGILLLLAACWRRARSSRND